MSAGDAREDKEVRGGRRMIIRDGRPRGAPARVAGGDEAMAAVGARSPAIHTIARRRRRMV